MRATIFSILPHLLGLDVNMVLYCLDIRWPEHWYPSVPSSKDKVPKNLYESLLFRTCLWVFLVSVLPVFVTKAPTPCPITLVVPGLTHLILVLVLSCLTHPYWGGFGTLSVLPNKKY